VNRGLVASRWQESHGHSVELGRAHRFRLSGWRSVVKNIHSRIDVANRRVQALALRSRLHSPTTHICVQHVSNFSMGVGILTGLFNAADKQPNDKPLGISGQGSNAGQRESKERTRRGTYTRLSMLALAPYSFGRHSQQRGNETP